MTKKCAGDDVDSRLVYPPIRTFHPRRGRMGAQKLAALETLLPRYQWIPTHDALPDGPLIVEIGFGMGDATAEMAAMRPTHTWLAMDIHTPGIAHLSRLLDRHSITNVRICTEDAVDVLRAYVPEASIDALHIFFPDPWPKLSQQHRRLIQSHHLDLLISRLRLGGLLHVATDWEHYAKQIISVLRTRGDVERIGAPKRPQTKYERMGIEAGRTITDVAVVRTR